MMPSSTLTRLTAATALSLIAACNPLIEGECVTQADCGDGSVCHSGLCVNPSSLPDGGDPEEPIDELPKTTITVVSPDGGSLLGPVELPVEITVPKDFEVDRLTVALIENELIVIEAPASHDGDRWTATLDLSDDEVASGVYDLIAIAVSGEALFESEPVSITVDRSPPTVVRVDSILPSRNAEHPAAGAFVLGEAVVLEVKVVDEPAGISTAPILNVPGVGDVLGEAVDSGVWRYRFPSKSVGAVGLTKRVDVTIAVKDDLGNAASVTRTDAFRIDRRAWRWVNPAPQTVTAAPAIVGDLLVVGDKAGNVSAVDRVTGATVWTHALGNEIVGHVASKGTELFVVTSAGEVVWLDATVDAHQREIFRCPGTENLVAAPPAGGLAVATTSVLRDGVPESEALLAYVTTGGKLRLLRRSGFTRAAPQTGTVCALEHPLQDATQDGITPALRTDGDAVLVHVGLAGGKLVRVRVTDDGAGSLSLTDDWPSATSGLAVKATVSLAEHDGEPRLLVSGTTSQNGKGRVQAWSENGTRAWETDNSGKFSNASVETTAVSANGTAWAMNRSGLLQRLQLSNGGLGSSLTLPARDPGKPRSTGVLGDDGNLYMPSGPRLSVVSDSATVLWSLDTRPTGTGTATEYVDAVTPALDCDGHLFVVVNGAQVSRIEALVTDATGLARNGWPKGGRDNRNTFHFMSGSASTCVD